MYGDIRIPLKTKNFLMQAVKVLKQLDFPLPPSVVLFLWNIDLNTITIWFQRKNLRQYWYISNHYRQHLDKILYSGVSRLRILQKAPLNFTFEIINEIQMIYNWKINSFRSLVIDITRFQQESWFLNRFDFVRWIWMRLQ